MSKELLSFAEEIQKLTQSQTPFVLVTFVQTRGSAPQIPGAKIIVTAQGLHFGTIGGGKIENHTIQYAQKMLEDSSASKHQSVTWNLQTDIGMTCGGEVQFLFEAFFLNEWQVTVFGAGHVAQSFIPMLLNLRCQVTCIDQRAEWLEKLPSAVNLKRIQLDDLTQHVQYIPENSFVLLMTQGHGTDLPVLIEILKTRDFPYVGCMGSRQKAKVIQRDLEQSGISQQKRQSYFCPVGLPIGNNTPAEISISILAQLLQTRDQ